MRGTFIVVLGLAAFALWLFLKDNVDFDSRRSERVSYLRAERDRLAALQAEAVARIAALQAEAAEHEDKIKRTARVIETLRSLENWWDRLFGTWSPLTAWKAEKTGLDGFDSPRQHTFWWQLQSFAREPERTPLSPRGQKA